MRSFIAIILSLMIVGVVAPAWAEDTGNMQPTSFNRDLVSKVKKSVIAIWIFQPVNQGVQAGVGIGSGVIFQALPEENAAYALTNHHVAGDSTLLQVELWDRTTYLARMVATEPGIDTALIKIENIPPDAYEAAPLGDSDAMKIGEPALAMGAPGSQLSLNSDRSDPMIDFGLHSTATMRVMQGKSTEAMRFSSFWAGWKGDLGQQVMTNLPWTMVTQSAINGGNSGGPLFNSKGEIIGLNHASFNAGSTLTQNQNYSIPINFSKNFALQIINTGKYELPWMGLDIMFPPNFNSPPAVGEFIERYYDAEVIKVFNIRKDSPAERAGFQNEDIILEFDGQIFPDVTAFRTYVFTLPIGKQVPVLVERETAMGKSGIRKEKVDLVVEIGVKRTYDAEFSF